MASNYTSSYNLNQWSASDRVLRTEFNADNAKIDAALAGKASASSVSSLQTTVNGLKTSKADKSALDSLQTTVNGLKTSKADKTALDALKTTVAQHTATLSGKGNCQLYTTSYTGSGVFGAESPTSLTFPKKPVAVFITIGPSRLFLFQGDDQSWSESYDGGFTSVKVTWTGNTVKWYTGHAEGQMNVNRRTYRVIALLQAG